MTEMRTKADFRALRETVGLNQAYLAQLLGIHEMTVKDWEKPQRPDWQPNQQAWDLLDQYKAAQVSAVEQVMQQVHQIINEIGNEPRKPFELTYYRMQQDYEQYGRDDGYYGVANANARACAAALEAEGFEVRYLYPDDPEHFYNKIVEAENG